MKRAALPPRILAVDPTCRGFGYAVLEGPETLLDWGMVRRPYPAVPSDKVEYLLDLYQPQLLVVEDHQARGARRGDRARQLIEAGSRLAKSRRVKVVTVAVTAVRALFGDGKSATKHAIATAITEQFPSLADRLRPKRRIGPEAERMGIFDAVAFGLAYYFLTGADTPR
jgi:hypothetical protein